MIFSTGFYVIFGSLAVGLMTNKLLPGFWFWGATLGFSLGVAVSTLRYKLRLFEVLEAAGIGHIFILMTIFLADSISRSSYTSLVASLIMLGLVLMFFFLKSKYKRFSWYKSGKVGFSGLITLGLFFILRASFAFQAVNVLSYIEKFKFLDFGVSILIAIAMFLSVYKLSMEGVI